MPSALDVIAKRRPAASPETDPSTLSNYTDFSVSHTSIYFDVDFDKKVVNGTVTYKLAAVKATEAILLDASYLDIFSVKLNDKSISDFSISARKGTLGSCLTIPAKDILASSPHDLTLEVAFATTSECLALQFLEKSATDGKKSPYLFSQCQAIHARSLFPGFDTPAVKSPYSFKIKLPLPALLSGRPVASKEEGVYLFEQPIPIPSYLVSIASGDITKAPIGPRSHVYCEPVNIERCQYEFEDDMERFMQVAEKLVFPYEWDQYDALVLPSSFPYGGMENPNITFATPTLISGDRENVDVLAHELAHSWSGNLVTNCSWEHFWLNEGWTVYLERRIQGAIHGEPTRHFSAIIGWSDLENTIKAMGATAEKFSTLVQNQKDGTDPDDAFSTVPYEKGSTLLYVLEQTVGGTAAFDPFVKHYFNTFKYKSLDTYQFIDELYGFFADKHEALDLLDWEAWLYKPGMPPIRPNFDTSLVDQCYLLADRWLQALQQKQPLEGRFSPKDIELFTANQLVVFLETLSSFNKQDGFLWSDHVSALEFMTEVFKAYSASANCEVVYRWFALQVRGHNTAFYDKLGQWLGTVGRMKFVRPGFRVLNEVARDLAVKYFQKFELTYHPICRAMVKKDLGLS